MLPNFNTTKKEPWWLNESCVLQPFNKNFYKAFSYILNFIGTYLARKSI